MREKPNSACLSGSVPKACLPTALSQLLVTPVAGFHAFMLSCCCLQAEEAQASSYNRNEGIVANTSVP